MHAEYSLYNMTYGMNSVRVSYYYYAYQSLKNTEGIAGVKFMILEFMYGLHFHKSSNMLFYESF